MLSIFKNTRAIGFAKDGPSKDRSEESQSDEGRFSLDQVPVSAGPVNAASSLQTAPARHWLRRILERMTSCLLRPWRRSAAHPARLALIERIALGPKQSLLLVATSSEAASAFFPLPNQGDAGSTEDEAVRSPAEPSCLPQKDSFRNLRSNTGPAVRPANRIFRRSVNEPHSGLWFESRISW